MMNTKKRKNTKNIETKKTFKEKFNDFKHRLELAGNLDSKPDVDIDIELFNKLKGFKQTEKKALEMLLRERLEIYYIRSKIYCATINIISTIFYFMLFVIFLTYSMVAAEDFSAIVNGRSGVISEFPLSLELLLLLLIIHLLIGLYALFFNNIKAPNKIDIWFVLFKAIDIYKHITIVLIILSLLFQFHTTARIVITPIIFFTALFILISAFIYYGLYSFFEKFISPTSYLFARYLSKHVFINGYQDTDLIMYFFLLISFIQKHQLSIFSKIGYKKAVIEYLDKIAIEFFDFINRTFSSKDPQFKDWVTENTEEIISFMNSRKAILFNTDKKSLLEFEKYCKDSFIHLLNGEWGKLAKLERVKLPKRDWKVYILEFSKSLVVGGVPVFTVYLMDKYQFIDISTVNYLYFATIIWAVINLMLAIEPGILDRIKLAKDMTEIIKKAK